MHSRGVFERALGDEWEQLHPQLRERYGLTVADDQQAIGRGTMRRIERSALAVPVLRALSLDDILVPERGMDVPFTITSTPIVDENGYDGLVLHRTFEFDSTDTPGRDLVKQWRHRSGSAQSVDTVSGRVTESRPDVYQFVDTLRWNPFRECITDLLGRRGQIAVDLSVTQSDGTLEIAFGQQWLRLGDRYVPLPSYCGVNGTLSDWYNETSECYEARAAVRHPLLGRVFGYRGSFATEFHRIEAADADTLYRSHCDTTLPGQDEGSSISEGISDEV